VERGFRFIKDPGVVAVYTAMGYRVRQALKKQDKTVPDQKGKPATNPTARWIFQLFVGIHVLELPNGKQMTLNLKQEHRDILSLLSYLNVYS
jgi:hypothetical protein